MRVVAAASLGGGGHLEPVVAVGRRLTVAGHDVSLLVPPALEPAARESGLPVHVGAEPPHDVVARYRGHLEDGEAASDPGRIDRELFAEHGTRAMLPTATALVERLRPALVVRESCEYASAVAARRAGIPFATIAISLARIEHDVLAMVAPVVDGFADGSAEAIARAPLLTALPEALDPSPWSTTVRYRAAPGTPGSLPPWEGAGAGPLIYATFGSVVGHTGLAARVFRGALDALGSLPVRALLTVGRAIDPSSLGPVPPNVRVERWVPQAVVLAACDVVVCHGGSGTTYGALAAGVPVIVCPLYADNARNGAAVARAGAGLLVAPPDAAASWATSACELGPSLRGAIHRGLDDPTLRVAAGEIRREMGSYPLVDEALAPLGPSSPRR